MINLDRDKLARLGELLDGGPLDIVLVGHTNPDGDAVGSMLAWGAALESRGHRVSHVVPNGFPSFLAWLDRGQKILVFKNRPDEVEAKVKEAGAIFFMDFNKIDRLEALSNVLGANTEAPKILIDHHLDPPMIFDVAFSHPEASSTSYIVFGIICELYGEQAITRPVAEAIYVGMMTDTGNFSFGNLTPGLYRALATLAERKIDVPKLHHNVYNSYSGDRMRLLGYVLGEKMKFVDERRVAYITLSESELKQYDFQVGDTEGFVNYPLTIKGMRMSAMFVENSRFIRVSLRSYGEVDVNQFARRYFEGGGHKNAAGGKSFVTMEQTVERFLSCIEEFFSR
ncbi:MAG: DHH family phosphoesterase [Rikenellaceae bacterium]|jgi:phosphoesterase RecJ-like protein|nr:DHH family phosphoesterase [Rikenellaceae bacterium]